MNDRLQSTCGELEVKFVDNDTNFTFRNGAVDFATLNRDGIHLSQSGTGRFMTNLSLPKPQRQYTHGRPTREAAQANMRGANTTSDCRTAVGAKSSLTAVGAKPSRTAVGANSHRTAVGAQPTPHAWIVCKVW